MFDEDFVRGGGPQSHFIYPVVLVPFKVYCVISVDQSSDHTKLVLDFVLSRQALLVLLVLVEKVCTCSLRFVAEAEENTLVSG